MMDCNRGDAIKAKNLAEKRMENKDFVSARRYALKAQQLHPGLEDISKIILVCDVLCLENKIMCGKEEKDWYAILKIEPSADEATIRKQYRKLVLSLHPDKNSFSGASDAFHLVNEAHRILRDRKLRMLYDFKLQAARSLVKMRSGQQSQEKANPAQYPQEKNVKEKVAPQCTNQQDQQDHQSVDNRNTFWTACTSCPTKFKYYEEMMGKQLNCRVCKATFTALRTSTPFQSDPLPQGEAGSLNQQASQSTPKMFDPRVAVQRDDDKKKNSEAEDGFTYNASDNPEGKTSNMESMFEKVGSAQGDSEPNNEHIPPYNESSNTKIKTSDAETTIEMTTNFGKLNSRIQKKRQRTGSIIDFEGNSCGNVGNVCRKSSSTKEVPTHIDNAARKAFQDNFHPVPDDPEFYEYPAPDFSNFDDLRAQSVFREGQIWALYDTLDAMPRLYALIRKVFSPKFKVQLIWLEPDPDDEKETKWVEEGLPVSCGKFRYGNIDLLQEIPMFSHLVYCEKDCPAGTFEVHPRKGETWALFKNWDISWHSPSETNKNYEYEFVEMLTGYSNSSGILVSFLSKVEGFSYIFSRETEGPKKYLLIPAKERFRFSHRVPSFKMTDIESNSFLAGSFELDPASLPFNMNDRVNPIPSPSQDLRELNADSEQEFYNFEENICPSKFHIGQIWAIYCDEDSLPRYYCKIERIDTSRIFNLHVRWFVACPPPESMISWIDNEMLTAVGNFKLMKGKHKKYSSTDPFSHLVTAEPTDEKDVYSIFPKKGQIWALYKNWSHFFNLSDLDDCKYEIVEVVGENDHCILVSIMKQIKGFKSVFRPQVKGQPNHAVEILKTEILRFSHQIPAFQLTKELGGSLWGCWELDAAALPGHL